MSGKVPRLLLFGVIQFSSLAMYIKFSLTAMSGKVLRLVVFGVLFGVIKFSLAAMSGKVLRISCCVRCIILCNPIQCIQQHYPDLLRIQYRTGPCNKPFILTENIMNLLRIFYQT